MKELGIYTYKASLLSPIVSETEKFLEKNLGTNGSLTKASSILPGKNKNNSMTHNFQNVTTNDFLT